MFYSPCLLHSWQAFLRGSHGSNWLCLLACCCWAWARSACCLEALGCGAPGCTPVLLQPDHGSSSQQLLLERGACYSVSSASTFSAPSLTVPPGSSSWSPATQPQLQQEQQQQLPPPVLDLCNQVQSIWLPQGALDYMGRWWGGSNPESCTKEATLG